MVEVVDDCLVHDDTFQEHAEMFVLCCTVPESAVLHSAPKAIPLLLPLKHLFVAMLLLLTNGPSTNPK